MKITYETTGDIAKMDFGKRYFKYHAFEIGDSNGKLGIVIAQNSVKALDEGHNLWGRQNMYAMSIPREDLRESAKGIAL